MQITDNEFPVVVQAYDTVDLEEVFIAEQVVADQAALNSFTTRYAGRLIKVRALSTAETEYQQVTPTTRKRRSGAGAAIILILLVLIILIAIGFATGWIQENLGIHI